MITCDIRFLLARCRERGYTLDEVRPCIVSTSGRTVTIDETHPAYPATPRPGFCMTPPPGPGSELKKLLMKIGITASPSCACNARARKMDGWGPDECDRRMDEILGWLREETSKRGLPFVELAARMLVRRAIRNARRSAARLNQPA